MEGGGDKRCHADMGLITNSPENKLLLLLFFLAFPNPLDVNICKMANLKLPT